MAKNNVISIWWLRNLLYDHRPIWYLIFLIPCVFGVLVDPLFLYVPILNQDTKCIRLDRKLKIVTLTLRSLSDFCYIVDLLFLQVTVGWRLVNVEEIEETQESFRRRNPFISRLAGIIISDVRRMARTIWLSHTLIDILAVLPIPQVIIFFNLFNKSRGGSRFIWIFLNILILFQYLPRVFRIYQLLKELETTPNARRMMMRSMTSISKLVKGVYMFFLFILASHVFGALWYFFSYQREIACWKHVCRSKITGCEESIFDCDGDNRTFKNVTFLNNLCPISPANATLFDFGIFLEAIQSGMLSSRDFSQKFWRCFWWGLRHLSSFGQNLQTGSYAWENIFAVFISLTGMFLVLIYLSAILQIPRLQNLEDKRLEAICEFLRPVMYNESAYIIREGEPLDTILLIITQGTATTFVHPHESSSSFSIRQRFLRKGDFYGEELLACAFNSDFTNLPASPGSVKCCTKVEGFTLRAHDLSSLQLAPETNL